MLQFTSTQKNRIKICKQKQNSKKKIIFNYDRMNEMKTGLPYPRK